MLKFRKKDNIIVKSGKDKGKQGEIIKVFGEKNRALISKINIIKRHTRPTQTEPGGVMEKESPINLSNVQLVCPKCSQATKIKFDKLENGEKVRICKKCGEMVV
jgi:large subunit ribosomal protein L24